MHPGGAIELRFLGSLSLRAAPGHEPAALLAQPKRVALLAYLAAATPKGFHRRDALLPLFWPEADQEHARASLRKALHFLRHELGPDVILGRGDEEITVVPARCWCDAVAFEAALDAGDCEQALALYQGDLLAGFHLPDAPEFERWLEESRAGLRRRACRAAWSLVECAERDHRLDEAVRWARRAGALDPYDEPGIRRLVTLLDAMGDRAGAVRTYEEFARRLGADLELGPADETVALLEAIRSRNGSAAPQARPPAVAPPAEELQAAAEEWVPTPAPLPPTDAPRRRTPWLIGLGLVLLVASAALGGVMWRRRPPDAAGPRPGVVAVLPFDYSGSPERRYLADAIGELLSIKLDGAAGLRSIDPYALSRFTRKHARTPAAERGRLAARRFGAGRYVLGRIVEAGGRVQLSATVYDEGGVPEGSIETAADGPGRIFDLTDRLAEHILAKAQDTRLSLARVADQTTSSLPALKAYIEGERALSAGRTGPAIEAFTHAIELDSTFALAHYRLGMLAPSWAQGREYLARALRHSTRLGKHQRMLIEAQAAVVRGEHRRAEQLYRHVLADHPDDVEAWRTFAVLIHAESQMVGLAWVDAREPFERALELDPQDGLVLWFLAMIAAREGRREALDSLTERFLRLNPSSEFAGDLRGQRAIVLGDTAALERFVAELRTRADRPAQSGAGLVTNTTMDLTVGRRLWRLITEPSHSPGYRALAHVVLAKIELTNGRERAARVELERASALDPRTAFEHRVYYALTPFLRTPRRELRALRDSLERSAGDTSNFADDGLADLHRSTHRYLKLYLLGLMSARVGDEMGAQRYAAQLQQMDTTTHEGAFANDLAGLVRVEIARERGAFQEALTRLERAGLWTRHSSNDDTGDSPILSRMHERYVRAELLYQLRRYDEAAPWYRTLEYDFVYTGPANLRLAQIAERRGDRGNAIEHYARFVELWRDCDPALRPMRQQAESALARLRA